MIVRNKNQLKLYNVLPTSILKRGADLSQNLTRKWGQFFKKIFFYMQIEE